MKHQLIFFCLGVSLFFKAGGQSIRYTVANAHSHNDYENAFPFTAAYNEKFGSIEADIFLWNDSLIVGHTQNDIQYKRTLQRLYLDPLQEKAKANNGYPYSDSARCLQLLIDIKTEAVPTLDKLIQLLYKYPILIHSGKILFVVTGNRPPASAFGSYPPFILFDGELKKEYPDDALEKIVLLSGDLKNYTQWDGNGTIPAGEKKIVDSLIKKIHRLNKKIRFWNAPDFANAWYQLIEAGVDYINTDHIPELSVFLSKLP